MSRAAFGDEVLGVRLELANTATLMPLRIAADRAPGELRVFGQLADQVVLHREWTEAAMRSVVRLRQLETPRPALSSS